jgi:hypothetical protein
LVLKLKNAAGVLVIFCASLDAYPANHYRSIVATVVLVPHRAITAHCFLWTQKMQFHF